MRIKKHVCALAGVCALALALAGCGRETDKIAPVSREDGSGTRGAFVELFGIEQTNESGEKIDDTTDEAEITNSTAVTMLTIAGNKNAIGYISLGSLNDMVTAVKIDGVQPSAENVKNGSYKISRPFNVAAKGTLGETAADFIAFILSSDGQAVVAESGYIPVDAAEAYAAKGLSGKIVVAGSSSVAPVMEKLKEAYVAKNPNVTIEVQQSDSTTGVNSVIDGVCDIGMTSRALKDSEWAAGLESTVIALDGIAVIVHNESGIDALTSEQVRGIYTGEITSWAELG